MSLEYFQLNHIRYLQQSDLFKQFEYRLNFDVRSALIFTILKRAFYSPYSRKISISDVPLAIIDGLLTFLNYLFVHIKENLTFEDDEVDTLWKIISYSLSDITSLDYSGGTLDQKLEDMRHFVTCNGIRGLILYVYASPNLPTIERCFCRECCSKKHMRYFRSIYIHKFGYNVINLNLISRIASFIGGSKTLSIMAGKGVIEYFLQRNFKTDIKVTSKNTNEWNIDSCSEDFPIENIDWKDALNKYPTDVLFVSWIPRHMADIEKLFDLYNGNKIVYLGETFDGCCASNEFFERMLKDFKQVEFDGVDDFWGINNCIYLLERKSEVKSVEPKVAKVTTQKIESKVETEKKTENNNPWILVEKKNKKK